MGGDGPVCSPLAFFGYLLNPLFCEQARWRLRLELFAGKFSLYISFLSLSLSLSLSLFLSIPQFGLLSQVSSLRSPSGHSDLVLTLSNAAYTFLFCPSLLVADVSVWATSPLGVAFRHVICGVYLFIFLPGYVAL